MSKATMTVEGYAVEPRQNQTQAGEKVLLSIRPSPATCSPASTKRPLPARSRNCAASSPSSRSHPSPHGAS